MIKTIEAIHQSVIHFTLILSLAAVFQLTPRATDILYAAAGDVFPQTSWPFNKPRATDILKAAADGKIAEVEAAIAAGADVNKRSAVPLISLGPPSGYNKEGDLNYVEGASWTPLIYTVFNGHVDVARLLLNEGADAEARDHCGLTALMFAILKKNKEIVNCLIDGGASIETHEDIFGMTSAMWAVIHGDKDLVELLIKKGAKLDSRDNSGWTLLHYACNRGREELSIDLIKRGADVNAKDKEGNTPLMIAANQAKVGIIKLLLRSGADKTLKNSKGLSALDLAQAKIGMKGLTYEKIGEDVFLISDGFLYQKNVVLDSKFTMIVTGIIDERILQYGGASPLGQQDAVGVSWIFNKPGLAFINNGYKYTSLRTGASVEFKKEGALLQCFKGLESKIHAMLHLMR